MAVLKVFDGVTQVEIGGTSDTDAIHDNISGEIAAVTEKGTPVSADLLLIEDSAASNAKKRIQIGNLNPTGVIAANVLADNAIVRGNGGVRGVQDGTPTIADNGVVNVPGIGDGGLTNYDLNVGDVTTPSYGMLRLGNALIGRTSYNVGNIDLDGAILYRNIGGPVTSQIEHIFTESTGNTCRFAIPKSGVGNATYNARSMLIAGPAPADTDMVTVGYWQTANSIFHNLACDTSGTGADLGVQNDLEVEGNIYADTFKESTPAAGITFANDIQSPTIITPTIANLTNMTHDHSNAAGGGTFAIGNTTGILTHEQGGLEADVSAYSGFPYITGGVTAAVNKTGVIAGGAVVVASLAGLDTYDVLAYNAGAGQWVNTQTLRLTYLEVDDLLLNGDTILNMSSGDNLNLDTTGTGEVVVKIGGSEKVRFNANGQLLIGRTSALGAYNFLELDNDDYCLFSVASHDNRAGRYAGMRIYRSRGTSASPTTLVSGDDICRQDFYGYSNAYYARCIAPWVECDGVPSGTTIPMRWSVWTGTSGVVLRFEIDSAGDFDFGGGDLTDISDITVSGAVECNSLEANAGTGCKVSFPTNKLSLIDHVGGTQFSINNTGFSFSGTPVAKTNWTKGAYTTRRTIPDAATGTLEQALDCINTLMNDLLYYSMFT